LHASAKTIQSRKQEVPFEETERQIERYHSYVNYLAEGFVLDGEKALDEVIQNANDYILKVLTNRAHKRYSAFITK
jgi:hypothetical protein